MKYEDYLLKKKVENKAIEKFLEQNQWELD
jgi:hypothetical protein